MLLNSKKFGLLIEDIVKKKKLSYIDATILYCEENNIDTGTISNLINISLRSFTYLSKSKLPSLSVYLSSTSISWKKFVSLTYTGYLLVSLWPNFVYKNYNTILSFVTCDNEAFGRK